MLFKKFPDVFLYSAAKSIVNVINIYVPVEHNIGCTDYLIVHNIRHRDKNPISFGGFANIDREELPMHKEKELKTNREKHL